MGKKVKKAHGFGMRDLEDPPGVAPGLFQTPTSGRPPSFAQSREMTPGPRSTGYSPSSVSRSTAAVSPTGVGGFGSRAVPTPSVGSGTVNGASMAVSSSRRTGSYAGSTAPAANPVGPDNAMIQASRPRRSVTESGTFTPRTSRVTGTPGVRSNTALGRVMGEAKRPGSLPNPVGATLTPMAAPTGPSPSGGGEKRLEKSYSAGVAWNASHGMMGHSMGRSNCKLNK